MPRRIPKMTFGDRLRLARETAGLGSQQMADKLGKSRFTINGYESDRHPPQLATIVTWSRITDVDIEWLMTGECAPGESNPEPADKRRHTPKDDKQPGAA